MLVPIMRSINRQNELKLLDGAKGSGFLKIDSTQFNWNSEHPRNGVENLVNNWIDQSTHATDLMKRGNPWKTNRQKDTRSIFSSPQSCYMCRGTGQAWVATYLRKLPLIVSILTSLGYCWRYFQIIIYSQSKCTKSWCVYHIE